MDEKELRDKLEAAEKAARERIDQEDRKVSNLRSLNGGAQSGGVLASPEHQHFLAHMQAQTDQLERTGKLFIEACRELREMGATSATMFGCHAKFKPAVVTLAPKPVK